jgi:hypothetical protein
MERRFWKGLLFAGIVLHIIAATMMPIGLDAHVHATFVTDEMNDGEGDLEWGELRQESNEGSVPKEASSDDRWFAWHSIIELWFTIFTPSIFVLHILALVGGLGCLAAIYLLSKDLFDSEQALKLTALASIYPPLVRATGRFYQEGAILMIVALATFSLIKAIRSENKLNMWWVIPLLCMGIILSFKGMPLWYVPPAVLALFIGTKIRMGQIHIVIFAVLVELIVLYRNGISLTNPDIIPALLSAFIGCFIFIYCGMLMFANKEGESNEISTIVQRGSLMAMACLTGWIAALWVTEASVLQSSFFEIIYSFRNNPRYLSLLFIPLWYSHLLKSNSNGLSFEKKRAALVIAISAMLLINILVLSVTFGERGTQIIGTHLNKEIEDDDDILFISDSQLPMHRMYSIHLTLDPESDGNNIAFWRASDSNWIGELSDCNEFADINWIIIDPPGNIEVPNGWAAVDFDGSDVINKDYRLYTWSGENERCA